MMENLDGFDMQQSRQTSADAGVKGDAGQSHSTGQVQDGQPGGTSVAAGGGKYVPKSRLDEVIRQKNEALEMMNALADELTEEVPEEYRDMIPDLAPADKVKWLRAAQKRGLFSSAVAGMNSPDSRRTGGGRAVDFDGLSPQAMLRMGYERSLKK
jgi:hypothetical protein